MGKLEHVPVATYLLGDSVRLDQLYPFSDLAIYTRTIATSTRSIKIKNNEIYNSRPCPHPQHRDVTGCSPDVCALINCSEQLHVRN